MKALVSSDWHPDVVTMGVPRFAEVEEAVDTTVRVAIEREVDAYFFLGDLADPDSGGSTFRAQELAMRSALRLKKAGILSIWLAGNHDVCEDGSGATTLTPMKSLEDNKYIYVAEKVRLIHVGDNLSVLCLPFTPASHGVDLDDVVRAHWPSPDEEQVIVISHLSVPGIIPGEETKEMPRGREIGYPFDATKKAILRLQGHYHRGQRFDPKDGGPSINIPGSLARLTFGEEDHTPSYLLVEV